MMQIPPPSPAHLSLVSELFSEDNVRRSSSNHHHGERKVVSAPSMLTRDMQLASNHHQLPSFALRPSSSSSDTKAVPYHQQEPPLSLHQHHHPHEGHHSSAMAPRSHALRPYQQTAQAAQPQQPPRKMTRRKSPPQAILQKHSSAPDENGDPQLLPHVSSYKTLEKEYEKDTLRMLERIQKSRSFEKPKETVADASDAAAANATLEDSGFYIGDEEGDAAYGYAPEDLRGDVEDDEEEEEEIFALDL